MKQKAILIICIQFPPQPSIASLRTYSFAKYWARMGNDVTVLTTKKFDRGSLNLDLPIDEFKVIEVPYFNISHAAGELLKNFFRVKQGSQKTCHQTFNSGVSDKKIRVFFGLRRAVTNLANKFGLFINSRMPNLYDPWVVPAIKMANHLMESNKINLIFSSYAPPAPHIVAGILRKRYSCKWIADYRDLWIENHVWVGKWPFTAIEKVLEKKYVGEWADMITTVSEPLADVLRSKFSAPVHVIENGFDEDDYKADFPPYFTEKKIRIVYTGSIYPGKQDPSPLFVALSELAGTSEVIRRAMDNKLEVLFFGSENAWLASLIREHKVQRWVRQEGMVGRNEALRIQNQADLLLFLEWEDGSVDGILTGKLFEYLAMRKPILGIGVSSRTSPGALMENAGVGLAVGNDIGKILHVLINLLDARSPFAITPNENLIKYYTRRNEAERLFEIMNS